MGKHLTPEQWEEIKEYYLSDERISYEDVKSRYNVSTTAMKKYLGGLKSFTKKAHGKGKRHKTYITTGNYTTKNKDRIYEWQCEVCGTIKNKRVSNMNRIKSCECQKTKKPIDEEAIREKERRRDVRKKKKELQAEIDRLNQEIRDIKAQQKADLIGSKWNRLTILEHIEDNRVRCQCECGNESTPQLSSVLNENTRSCGCLQLESLRKVVDNNKTHGMTKTGVYSSWRAMRRRCYDPNFLRYERYGGRGITVCEEWDNSFESFYEYMGERPEGMTLDRIDPDGNYEPGNVRWADPKTQSRNQSRYKDREWDDE